MTLQTGTAETVALPAALTIRTVQSTKDVLMAGLSSATSIVLDIPDDADCDLSFVQLVESARMFAQTHDKVITLRSPANKGLLSTLERGGFLTAMDPSDRFFWFHERQMQ
jgi:STAS domain